MGHISYKKNSTLLTSSTTTTKNHHQHSASRRHLPPKTSWELFWNRRRLPPQCGNNNNNNRIHYWLGKNTNVATGLEWWWYDWWLIYHYSRSTTISTNTTNSINPLNFLYRRDPKVLFNKSLSRKWPTVTVVKTDEKMKRAGVDTSAQYKESKGKETKVECTTSLIWPKYWVMQRSLYIMERILF